MATHEYTEVNRPPNSRRSSRPQHSRHSSGAPSGNSRTPFAQRPQSMSDGSPQGRRWQADIKDWPAFLLALGVLCAWIGGAVYLVAVQKVLPLNYFDQSRFRGVLDNGNYNTLIAAAGGLAAALIGWAIRQGFNHVIRERFMAPEGLDGREYEGFAYLATSSILWKFRLRAIGCLALFAIINQFASATQSAFGTSTIPHNITRPFYIPRLTDNVDQVNTFSGLGFGLLTAGDINNAVSQSWVGLAPGENGNVEMTIDDIVLIAEPGEPLLSLAYALTRINVAVNTTFPFTDEQTALIGAGGSAVQAYVTAEGYIVNATCQFVDAAWQRTSLGNGLDQIVVDLGDCGTATSVYDDSALAIVDSIACPASSAVYMWLATPSITNGTTKTPAATTIMGCSVAGESGLYPGQLNEQMQAGRSNGPGTEIVGLETIMPAVINITGQMYFDRFGVMGSPELLSAFVEADKEGVMPLDVARLAVQSAILVNLVKLGDILQNAANMQNDSLQLQVLRFDGHYQVNVLKMHLSGAQYAWFVLPAALLSLVVVLSFFRIVQRSSGDTDFVNPVQVALIALPDVVGAGTGKWSKEHEKQLGEERFRFGVPDDQPRSLLLTTGTTYVSKPKKGTQYV